MEVSGRMSQREPLPMWQAPSAESIPVPTWHPRLKAFVSVSFLFPLACGGTSVLAMAIFLGKCADVDRSMTDSVIPRQNWASHFQTDNRERWALPLFCPGLFFAMSLLYRVWLCAVYFVFKEMHGINSKTIHPCDCCEVWIGCSDVRTLNLYVHAFQPTRHLHVCGLLCS